MKQKLLDFIQQELLNNRQTISSDQDLLVSGLIDSMAAMRLVAYFEQQTGMPVPPEDVTLENFVSVDAITRYHESRSS